MKIRKVKLLIKIESASEKNIHDIFQLVQNTILEIYSKYYRDEVVQFFCDWHSETRITKDVTEGKTYIIFDNGKMVATGTAEAEHITRVYVLPEYQGHGLGSALMDFLEDKTIRRFGSAW